MPTRTSRPSHPLRRIAALGWSLALALSAYLATAVPVAACDCMAMEPMKAYADQPSWTIFSGVVQAPEPNGVPVLVSRWFQGDGAGAIVWIQGTWGTGGASCETPLPPAGSEWIFLASRRETGELDVNLCTPHAAVGTDAGAAMLADAIATFGDGGGAPHNEEPPAAPIEPGAGGSPSALAVFDPVVLVAGGGAAIAVVAAVLFALRRRQTA